MKYSLWLHHVAIREQIKVNLLSIFGDFKTVYNAKEEAYRNLGLDEKIIVKLVESKKYIGHYEKEIIQCQEQGIKLMNLLDENYPVLLAKIPDPPMVLYIKGKIDVLNKPIFGIVGARNCLEYGYQTAQKIASELADMGVVIVSGMAMGIDGAAHQGALVTGETIGVLGTGVDVCYPSCNKAIYQQIPKQGCIISEYKLGTQPRPYQFPKRNRIISGLASGILIVEADKKSGSLITADLALEYNRDVFAVPGDIRSKLSLGTNELIQNGAICVTKAQDIIEQFPLYIKTLLKQNKKTYLQNDNYELAQQETMVYAYVSWEPIFLDELLTSTKLSYEAIYTSLVTLELKGYIKKLPGERYVRA